MKEHQRNVKNKEIEKSAVAAHCCQSGHTIKEEVVLLEQVNRVGKLGAMEKIHMAKNYNVLMNEKTFDGLDDILFKMIRDRGKDNSVNQSLQR